MFKKLTNIKYLNLDLSGNKSSLTFIFIGLGLKNLPNLIDLNLDLSENNLGENPYNMDCLK